MPPLASAIVIAGLVAALFSLTFLWVQLRKEPRLSRPIVAAVSLLICSLIAAVILSLSRGVKSRLEPPSYPSITIPEYPRYNPSTSVEIPHDAFISATTMGDTNKVLKRALDHASYTSASYYHVPDGYVLATPLERIASNGTPLQPPYRWLLSSEPAPTSFKTYLAALLISAPQGYYREISFLVTNEPLGFDKHPPTLEEATHLWSAGFTGLPHDIASTPLRDDYQCLALVYEFTKEANGSISTEQRIDAKSHLIASGLGQPLRLTTKE